MERLQKVIAHAGIASRRKAEELILQGVVTVNGEVVKTLGVKVTPKDRIEVNGVPIEKEEPVYYVLHKPVGVLSSSGDDRGRTTVVDLIEGEKARLFPVGRLDYDTSGLIILTNDGDFSHILMHPSHEVEKTYVAKVEGIPNRHKIKQLEEGIELEDGVTSKAKAKLRSVDKKNKTAMVELIIHEGRNRQVRRMFEAIGHRVKRLKRVGYSFLILDGLASGEYRRLRPYEVKKLKQLAVTKFS
ncbi:pseudouridine synthase [Massilibacterium senegalense]|uniref:pseudouridine synthase n=1 Tax=Massilibacterium senegalense TaxID=1632858 RepID=UPI000785CBF8|nr:pseudouridine synthase [Massilibacterium senegalense]